MPDNKKTATGNLQTALNNAAALLAHDPRLAAEQANEILVLYPGTTKAKRILASAYRLQGQPQKGLDVLVPLHAEYANSPDFLQEYAQCLGAVGRGDEAISTLRRATSLDPKHAPSWLSLAHQLTVAGDIEAMPAATPEFLASVEEDAELEALLDGGVTRLPSQP